MPVLPSIPDLPKQIKPRKNFERGCTGVFFLFFFFCGWGGVYLFARDGTTTDTIIFVTPQKLYEAKNIQNKLDGRTKNQIKKINQGTMQTFESCTGLLHRSSCSFYIHLPLPGQSQPSPGKSVKSVIMSQTPAPISESQSIKQAESNISISDI